MTGLWLAVALLALFAGGKAILFDTLDPDCFWHLRVAEQIRAEGVRPLVDHLSFASLSTAWTPYSWLAELGMKAVWDQWGFRGAIALQAMVQAGLILLIALTCVTRQRPGDAALSPSSATPREGEVLRPRGFTFSTIIATAVAALLCLAYVSFRPVTFALALFALCAFLLVRDRHQGERSGLVWLVVPLTAIMTNIHLYAVLIPLSAAAMLAGSVWEMVCQSDGVARSEGVRRVRRYAVLTVAALLACLATPLLPGVVATAVHYQCADAMVAGPFISELQPFYRGGSGKLYVIAVAGILFCVIRRRRLLRAGELIWLLLAGLLLLRWGRFAPVFAIIAAPMFAVTLPEFSDRVFHRPAVCALMAAVLAMGLFRIVAAFPNRHQSMDVWLNRHGPGTPGYPCDAARFVEARISPRTGRLLNEFSWGGYLEWRLGGRFQALLDGRTQLFSSSFWHAAYLDGAGPRAHFLNGIEADAAIVPLAHSVFRDTLARLGWRSCYHDDRAEVLVPPDMATKQNAESGRPTGIPSAALPSAF